MMAAAALVKFDINNYNDQALHLGDGYRIEEMADLNIARFPDGPYFSSCIDFASGVSFAIPYLPFPNWSGE